MTILGENGAGKSTLAKIVCGLYKTKKTVFIDDLYLENLSFEKRAMKLNYIPAKLEVYDEFLRVKEFLRLSLVKGDLKSAVALSGFDKRDGEFCKDLSSGEAQMLLLASSIAHNADITIFDEPVSNLDPKRVKRVFEMLKSDLLLQKIVITHNLHFAYKLGYSILFIKDSRGEFYENCDDFFEKENLLRLFGKSVVKKDDFVVMEL